MRELLWFSILCFAMTSSAEGLSYLSADVSVAHQTMNFVVHRDGRSEIRESTTMEALNDAGRVQLALQSRAYRASSEKVHVLEAKLLEGTKWQPIPTTAITERAASSQLPGLTDVREIMIPFEGVKVHSKTLVTVEHQTVRPRVPGYFDAEFEYGVGSPELDSSVRIESEMPLYYQISDSTHRLEVTQSHPGDRYILEIKMNAPIFVLSAAVLKQNSFKREQLEEVPRVVVSSALNWQNLTDVVSPLYEARFKEPLPRSFHDLIQKIPAKASETEKIAWLRESLGDYMAYSGRWTEATSGWQPRSLQTIATEKVGDCKDFATAFVRLAREIGLKADVVFTFVPQSALDQVIAAPLESLTPLPVLRYFNHAVARVQRRGEFIYVDPTLNVAQGLSTDIHLYHLNAWVLSRETPEKFKTIPISKSLPSNIESTATSLADGLFVTSKMTINDALAQYITQLQFGNKADQLSAVLAELAGFPGSEQIKITKSLPRDKKSSHLEFEMQFFNREILKTDAQKIQFNYLAFFPVFNWRAKELSPPDVPFQVDKVTHLMGYFARDEEKSDCFVRGAVMNTERTTHNLTGEVLISELSSTGSLDVAELSKTRNGNTFLQSNVSSLNACRSSLLIVEKIDPLNKTQVPFEKSPRAIYEEHPSPNSFFENLLVRWRTNKDRLAQNPRDAEGWFNIGRANGLLANTNGDAFIPEFVEASADAYQKAVTFNPNFVEAWAMLGKAGLRRSDITGALKAFYSGYALAPTDSDILFLGGEICDAQKYRSRAAQYYRLAGTNAKDNWHKVHAIEGEIETDLADSATINLARPLVAQLTDLTPNGEHDLSYAAGVYIRLGDYAKAIELERRALKLMDSGIGRSLLAAALGQNALALLSAKPPNLDQAEVEASEALAINATVGLSNFAMAWVALRRLQTTGDRRYLLVLEQAVKGSEASSMVSLSERQRLVRLFQIEKAKFDRGIASAPEPKIPNGKFPALKVQYLKLVSTTDGQRYDEQSSNETMHKIHDFQDCALHPGTSFSVALEIDQAGTIIKWEGEFLDSLSACLAKKMIGQHLAPPKTAPFVTVISASYH
jgi:tetratricopeptide (TPR) repeat protein/transglutaminase-like putative cysteine protease